MNIRSIDVGKRESNKVLCDIYQIICHTEGDMCELLKERFLLSFSFDRHSSSKKRF